MTQDLDRFRHEARDWIAANYPASLRSPLLVDGDETPWGGRKTRYGNPDVKVWMDRMARQGWSFPEWAPEHGGAGLPREAAKVLREELAAAGCRPPVFSFGLMMLAPVLHEFASDEQKQRFLPPIARGEIRWCQGYSEPGAGSDLAGLRTRAEDCQSRACDAGSCRAATCSDGVRDGFESDVDCGGPCAACAAGLACAADTDCANNNCNNGIASLGTCQGQ